MSERTTREYFRASLVFRLLSTMLVGLGVAFGIFYMFIEVPLFQINDFFQVASVTFILVVSFLISGFILAPFEYRLDRKYGRTTWSFGGYLSYKMRSRLILLIPFSIMLLVFVAYWIIIPSEDVSSVLFIYASMIVIIFAVAIIMPRIYGSMLRKERISNPDLSKSIQDLANRMGIKGKIEGAYEVPVRGLKVVNAAQLGFGRRHGRIYLIGDIEEVLTKNEVEAVVAHELAHMKARHVLKLALLLLSLLMGFYLLFTLMTFTILYPLLLFAVDISDVALIASVIFLDLVCPLALAFMLILKFRRMFEFEADRRAALITSPKYLSTSLDKLADYNFIPRKFPHIIGSFISHPSIADRIDRLTKMEKAR
jgi:Zn-dependent protease with chaperone function